MYQYPKKYQVIVIGGGHAGIEAALASARRGAATLLISHNIDLIGQMPCNPSIGGIGKGQLVKEVDALGGEMGLATDHSGIQYRRLNTRKGPAVQSSRAQADKMLYRNYMQSILFKQDNLDVRQDEVLDIRIDNDHVSGVFTAQDTAISCDSVVITPGTFLDGVVHIGEQHFPSGRLGEKSSQGLSRTLRDKGFRMGRFKTGTPARLDIRTIDFDKMERQDGDNNPRPFSFWTKEITLPQMPCYLTHTTQETHRIIRENIHRAPMYSGVIQATGVRYCPSVEDKVMKFPDRERHHVFVEPEGLHSGEYYPNGLSNGFPLEVQIALIHSVPGLEKAVLTRPAYAIEHDHIDPTELLPTMETKKIRNLYMAGQINGTTGYEEAAAQGLIAGINAAGRVLGKGDFVMDRSQGYIGVLLDDLTTRGTNEPYRMFTSRVEYRLLLREDNADLRLSGIGHSLGILPDERFRQVSLDQAAITDEISRLEKTNLTPTAANNQILKELGTVAMNKPHSLADLLKRTELKLSDIYTLSRPNQELSERVKEQVEIEIKYQGYIQEERITVQQFVKGEKTIIPTDLNYENISGLRLEEVEKLSKIRPVNLGQAARIPGIRPAAIQILMIYLKSGNEI